ncbi:Centromere protein C [Holothuria leucospilota]|uniref:Centromere protein C n=1 Tax=Holothuria leucospilota TaxID=206669 RepID=A0A9Q1HBS8_HOLLE|nr:Centromere protein C [Holothuria leucospilota]
MENHGVKYKPFVNPFYKEGIGRRTGAVLKTEVRKDSDGFEIFDDYFSESEAENSELSFDKENVSSNANRSKRTGRLPPNQKRSSPLRPMKSFSPAVSTDRSVVKSSEDLSTSKNGEETQSNPGNAESRDKDADLTHDEVAGNSKLQAVSSDKESNTEDEVIPGLAEMSQAPGKGEGGKSEAEIQPSDKESRESSSEEEGVPEVEENKTVSTRDVAGKNETDDEPTDEENRQSSSEKVEEEKKTLSARGVTDKCESEMRPSDKEISESSSQEEEVPEMEEDKTAPARGMAQEDANEEIEVEGEQVSEDEGKIVTSKGDNVQDMSEKEAGQTAVESNEEGASSERSSSGAEEEKIKNPENDPSPEKKQPDVDSPLQAQVFAMTKKRLSFSCATEDDVSASSHKDGDKLAINKEERMNNILENPDKEELVGESQEKPSFFDMINSKRKSGAVFSFRFSEILSSTANVSDHQSDQPDDDNIVIVAEEKEKSFFGKTGRKLGTKESAKSKVKDKSEKKGKSRGAGKKLKDSGKGEANSGSDDSGSNQTMVPEMETKEETVHKEELLEKSRKRRERRKNEDSVQHHQDNVDATSQVSGTRKEAVGKGSALPDTDGVGSEDISDMSDGNDIDGEDQVFIEASEDQNTTEIRKEGSKGRGSSRQRKSTSRAKKEEEKVRKKSIKEDSRTDRKASYVKKSSGIEKTGGATKGTSDEGEDHIEIGDAAGESTTELKKGNTITRRSSRRLKSMSKSEMEKSIQSKLQGDSRIERDSSVSQSSSEMEKTAAAEVNSDEDDIVIGDSEVHGTSVIEKDHGRKRKNSKPLKSPSKAKKGNKDDSSRVKEDSKMKRKGSNSKVLSKAKMEKSSQSTVKDDSRREKDGSDSQSSSDIVKSAAAEVNSDEGEIVIGDSEVHSTSVIEKDRGRKRKNSEPLKSASKAKKGKRYDRSRVENPKTKRKGSHSKILSKVEETAVSEEISDENKDQIMMVDSKGGSINVEKDTGSSASKGSAEIDEKKTTGRKKSVSTVGKGRRKSKKGESELASQEDDDGTEVRENASTSVTGQRRSKRIRSKTESVNEGDESHSDKESRNLQRKSTRAEEDKRGKEAKGSIEKDGSSSLEEAETWKENKSCSSQSEDDSVESMGDKKITKKSKLKEQKDKRSKAGKRKNFSIKEHLEKDENSQLEETKSKRTGRTRSVASHLHDNKGDKTKLEKETSDEDKKEEANITNGDGVQGDDPSKTGSEKSQGDRDDTINDLQLKGSSRKRKSTSLQSTKSKVKRGDKSKEERINTVKKTLDYGEEEDSDWEEIVDGDDEVVADDGTVKGDGISSVPESEKTNPIKVSTSKEKGEDSEGKEDEKNDSLDQQQAGSSIPQSILKSSKVYQKHRKHRRQRNLRLTFHEIAKPKPWIIPPNRDQKGIRRSKRNRVRPLEYWRNERAVYERRKSGGFALTGVNSPEDPDDPYKRSRKGRKKQRVGMRTRLLTPKNLSLHRTAPDDAIPGCSDPVVVVNPESQREVLVDVVKTPQSNIYVGPSGNHATDTDSFILTKALMQPAFSSGILLIRPESEKGLQLVQRDTMAFHIVRGKVAVTIHQTTQILESGAFFFVPQGNVYNIVNLRKDEAKLVFFQLKGSIDV